MSFKNCNDRQQYSIICRKLNELFIDRNVESVLRKKIDDISDIKFSFLMAFLVNINTNLSSLINDQADKKYNKKRNKIKLSDDDLSDEGISLVLLI